MRNGAEKIVVGNLIQVKLTRMWAVVLQYSVPTVCHVMCHVFPEVQNKPIAMLTHRMLWGLLPVVMHASVAWGYQYPALTSPFSRPAKQYLTMIAQHGMQDKKVVVVGGSIGGLAVAAALGKMAKMSKVTVFEGDSLDSWQECSLGAGIAMVPNCLTALEMIDSEMADSVVTQCSPITQGLTEGGKPKKFEYDYEGKHGRPFMFMQWKSLRQALADTLPDGTLQHSMTLTDVEEEDDGGVVAIFNHGEKRVEADLLVVADGVKSLTREKLQGITIDASEATMPRTICRAIVPFETEKVIPAATTFGTFRSEFGQRCAMFPAGKGITYWSATKLDAEDGTRFYADAPLPDVKEALLSDYAYCPAVCSVIDATPPEKLIVRRLATYPPERYFGRGNIALLGDAADPMDPGQGQGGSMAVEDAVQLALCCSEAPLGSEASSGVVAEVVRRYGEAREERVRDMQELSQLQSKRMYGDKAYDPRTEWVYSFQPVRRSTGTG